MTPWLDHRLASARRELSLTECQRHFGMSGEAKVCAGKARSALGYAALHGAMNPGLQKGNLGFAVKRPQRRFQQLGAEAGLADRADRRALRLVPGDIEPILRPGPRHLQQPPPPRKSPLLSPL